MVISSYTSALRSLTTTYSTRDGTIRPKGWKRFSCIDLHMCKLQGLQLPNMWTSGTKAYFPHGLRLAYGSKGRSHKIGWKLLMQCSRQTEQEYSKVSDTNVGQHDNMEKQSRNISDIGEIKSPSTAGQSTSGNESALKTVAFWAFAAVAFGIFIGFKDGTSKASEFFAGYLLEQSLSVDNLFVFILIFKYFQVPLMYQSRVLSYGIAGAIVFRASMIFLGAATLQRFEAVNLFLAGILLYSAIKLFAGVDEGEEDLSNNFIVKTCKNFIPVTSTYDGNRFFTETEGIRKATPLLLTVAVLELSDIAFAVDSIPAVFGVTRDPFIVFSSNMFAILGLRSLYTVISGSMSELEYLQPAVGVVLGFIGCKMVAEFFGYHTPTEISLGFVATILGTGVILSLLKNSDDNV
ncbi:thylakoid membrane protein TERC, chloroplastic isoform X3 [Cryptomeria japonica]|uniref:thylakoid membrane protein TERC, chloroplastic isoform X3 n=1 Tax=Cryptomeria japonica TaxID=3369 RepID=UPI0025ABA914|nr:thylakoid membrane protein TERC, chloroplastic isoform X3 [Cryptomeria japonica]